MKIPYHWPTTVSPQAHYDETDEDALLSALRSGRIIGDAEGTGSLPAAAAHTRPETVLLKRSCWQALEPALKVVQPGPGDAVVVSSFNLVSTKTRHHAMGCEAGVWRDASDRADD